MKVAIVTSTFPPYAGGIGNVALFNARELAKIGHEVTVFTPAYKQAKEEIMDIKVVRIKPLIKHGNAAFVPSLKWMLKGYNIIHLHYPFFGGAEVIWRYKRKFKKQGAKIVLHYHMDVVGKMAMRAIFKFHNTFMLPRIIKMADKVILTSFDYGENSNIAKQLKKNPDKFIEVPNGVDVNNFLPKEKDPALLQKYKINHGEKVVLFVGGLDKAHYFKGVEYLIEAMSWLRQSGYSWRLIIVGEGELKEVYRDLASQFKLHLKTIFAGYVSNDDLPKYYNLADVVVLPSVDKSEAFGLTLIEAMACSKPVVGADLPGVRSVITEKMDGLLVKPRDAKELAARINFFLNDPGTSVEFGKAGRRKVLLKYDWRKIGQQINELYKQLNLKKPENK